jgi:hypothetical protein
VAYELPFTKFIAVIKDADAKKQLSSLKLPDEAFFGESSYKIGKNVINISAKTTDSNVEFPSKKFKAKIVGKNLDLQFKESKIRFIVSSKKQTSNRNALGKKLADAGELATVLSLTSKIKTPEDTGQQIFIDDLVAFQAWKMTFDHTKEAVEKVLRPSSISKFHLLHDATDTSEFKKVIDSFVAKAKLKKDSWNPADVWVVDETKFNNVVKELNQIVKDYGADLVPVFNARLYDFYKKKLVYPISLKQLTTIPAKIEYTNVPGANALKPYDISINRFNCDLSLKGKEIGLFVFKNNDTGKDISMQVRGFPHGYGITQTEITSDGSISGGRVGKVPTGVVDKVMAEYGDSRISSISFFGPSSDPFGAFTPARINEVWSWYQTVIKSPKVTFNNKLTKPQFEVLIQDAKKNFADAETLCMKIQGLKMMYFFVTNADKISPIVNNMIAGAKKISTDNGFFIKIY